MKYQDSSSRKSDHGNREIPRPADQARAAVKKEGPSLNDSFPKRPFRRRVYDTGETVAQSGIYAIVHDGHGEPHSTALISGEPFPACEVCKQAVAYRLLRTAPYIFHDADFTSKRSRSRGHLARPR